MGRETSSTWKSDKWCIVLGRLIQQEKGPDINRLRKMAGKKKKKALSVWIGFYVHLMYRTKQAKFGLPYL